MVISVNWRGLFENITLETQGLKSCFSKTKGVTTKEQDWIKTPNICCV